MSLKEFLVVGRSFAGSGPERSPYHMRKGHALPNFSGKPRFAKGSPARPELVQQDWLEPKAIPSGPLAAGGSENPMRSIVTGDTALPTESRGIEAIHVPIDWQESPAGMVSRHVEVISEPIEVAGVRSTVDEGGMEAKVDGQAVSAGECGAQNARGGMSSPDRGVTGAGHGGASAILNGTAAVEGVLAPKVDPTMAAPKANTVRPSVKPARRGWVAGLCRFLGFGLAQAGTPQAMVQGELALERVRVVRNDLSESDLELVAVKRGAKQSRKSAAKSGWSELASRLFLSGQDQRAETQR